MMARCGRPEQDSCPRVVGCGASARKRRRLGLAPPKCARNPPPETTATQNPRANSRKPEQPNSPGLNAPGYRTAESRNSQQPGRRGSRPSRRQEQPNSRKPKQPTAEQPGLPRSRVDGVEAVPPKDRNSRKATTDFDLSAEVCPRRSGNQRAGPGLVRCAQHCERRISCGFWRGFHAKITGGFSDDGALRTTRAGLVSASGRLRRVSAEKTPVGFGAAKILKKSSRPNQRRAKNHRTKPHNSQTHKPTAPGSTRPATEQPPPIHTPPPPLHTS